MSSEATTAQNAHDDERVHWLICLHGGITRNFSPEEYKGIELTDLGIAIERIPRDVKASEHRTLIPWHIIEEVSAVAYPVSRETEG